MRVVRNAEAGKQESKAMDKLLDAHPAKKDLLPYEQVFKVNTEFYSTANPDVIEDALVTHLKEAMNIEAKQHDKKYKIKFKYVVKG